MCKSVFKKFVISIMCALLVFISFSKPILSKAHTITNTNNSNNDFSIAALDTALHNSELVNLNSANEVSDYLSDNESNISTGTTTQASLPSSVDNSATKYFPPIINQDELNSCNSIAAVYYQLTYTVNKELNRDVSNPNNIFSPTWVYNMTNKGLNFGTYAVDTLKVLSEVGAVSSTSVPIATKDVEGSVNTVKASKEMWLEASKYKVKEYYAIGPQNDASIEDASQTEYTDEDILAIKQALAMGEVLSVSTYPIRWHETKIKANAKIPANNDYVGQSIITRSSGFNYTGHRLTIVGYNDNIWVDINKNKKIEEGEKGAFKLANSWGPQDRNNGFVWMSYDAVKVKSSVDNSKIRNMLRTTGLFYVVGYTVDVDTTDEDCFVALDVETNDLESLNITIKATSSNNTITYEPAPFSNGLKRGFGPYSFNGKTTSDRGQFYIDLSNAIPNLTKENFDSYDWDIIIKDTSTENEIIIHSLQIYNKSNDSYTHSLINTPTSINNESIELTI